MRAMAFSAIFCWTFVLISFQSILCNGAPKPKLTDINSDCQSNILEQLDIEGLLNMRSTSKHFATMADDVFKRLYPKKVIGIAFTTPDIDAIAQLSYDIQLDNFKLAERVLKTFGHMIEKIEVVYDDMSRMQATKIEEYINTYCSGSLSFIIMTNFTSNPLAAMSKPFEKLQGIQMIGTAKRLAAKNAKLNQIFPALEKLFINIQGIEDENCLDVEFSKLTSVHLLFSFYTIRGFDPKYVEKLLENNPQITAFSTTFAPFSFLLMANSLLPNLEKFSVVMAPSIADYKGVIRYRNIKTFTLAAVGGTPPNFEFDHHLEKVRFHNFEPITKEFIDYFGKFRTIKSFEVTTLTKMCTINGDELSRLATKLPNLEEVVLLLDASVKQSDVMDFFRSCRNLRKLHLIYTNNEISKNFDTEFDELFDVAIRWDAFKREGLIAIEHKYNK